MKLLLWAPLVIFLEHFLSNHAVVAATGASAADPLDSNLDQIYSLTNISDTPSCKLVSLQYPPNNSSTNALNQSIVVENTLICNDITERNRINLLGELGDFYNSSLYRIKFKGTQPLVVELIFRELCTKFDCSSLAQLDLAGLNVDNFEPIGQWLNSWPHLESLDLSGTSLKSIESFLKVRNSNTSSSLTDLPNLKSLMLDCNSLDELNFNVILNHMPKVKNVSAINNSISSFICDEELRPKLFNQLQVIQLANSTINCDKEHFWLMKRMTSQLSWPKFPELEQVKCNSERLNDMSWPQRVSVLETRICEECDCKSIKKTNAISVDCNNKNLTALPDILPLNTKVLNLTSNMINSFCVPRNSKNWENITYVYLQDNLITSFAPLEINSKFMRNLAALDIRKNKFQEFPSHIFEQFINLDQVHLSDNPWLCDCEPTIAFQEWLQRQFHKVGDKDGITCGIAGSDMNGVRSFSLDQRLSSRVIYRLDKSELCPQDNLDDSQEWLNFANLLMSIIIVTIIFKVILDYIYQYQTKRLPHFFKLNF